METPAPVEAALAPAWESVSALFFSTTATIFEYGSTQLQLVDLGSVLGSLGVVYMVLGGVVGMLLFAVVAAYRFYVTTARPLLSKQYPGLIKPKQLKRTREQVAELRAQDRGSRAESCEWFNAVLARLFTENAKQDWFREFVILKVREELVDLKREPVGCFLSETKVSDVYLGSQAPTVSNATVLCTHNVRSDMTVLFDLRYNGGLTLVVDIETWFGLALSLRVGVKELNGRMFVAYTVDPIKLIHFGFVDPPKLDLDVTTLVMGRHIGLLDRLIVFGARQVIGKKLSLPAGKTKWFGNAPRQPPYPWHCDNEDDMYDFVAEASPEIAPHCQFPIKVTGADKPASGSDSSESVATASTAASSNGAQQAASSASGRRTGSPAPRTISTSSAANSPRAPSAASSASAADRSADRPPSAASVASAAAVPADPAPAATASVTAPVSPAYSLSRSASASLPQLNAPPLKTRTLSYSADDSDEDDAFEDASTAPA